MITAIKLFFSKNYIVVGLVLIIGVMSLLLKLEKTAHKATTSEYALFVTKTSALGEIRKAENKAKEERQQFIDETIVNSYEESLKQLKAHHEANPNTKYIYINRVQDTSSSSGGASKTSESAEGINAGHNGTEKTTTTRGSEEIQIDLHKASQEIVQCLELIEWNKNPNN